MKIYIFIDKLEFVIEAGLCHQSLLMNGETAVPGMATGGMAAYTDRCYGKLIHVCALHLYCFLLQLIRISW